MTKKTIERELPPGIQESDLKRPSWEAGDTVGWEDLREMGLQFPELTFYRTAKLGWVLCTLHISNPSSRQKAGTPARTYGIGVADEKIYTVGKGPHVLEEVTVHLSKSNLERLGRYVELWKKGMGDASQIRDRISSRRAQGQLHRAAGRSSWTW